MIVFIIRNRHSPIILAAAALLHMTLAHATPAAEYVVNHVAIDPSWNANQAPLQPDDPRLLGRVVEIGPHMLTTDAGPGACTVSDEGGQISLGAWLSNAFPAHGPRQPKEFGLTDDSGSRVAARSYRCDDPDPARQTLLTARRADGRILLAWKNQEALASLRPVGPADRPQPSFACADAKLAAEKTICSSLSLANWDKSLAAEYDRVRAIAAHVVQGKPQGDPGALRAEQGAWLKRRNACGDRAACLLRADQDRMDTLGTDALNGGAAGSPDDKATVDSDMQWYAQHRRNQ